MAYKSEKQLFSIREVADRCGLNHLTVRQLVADGDLGTVWISRRRMISLREIERAEQFGAGRPPKPRKQKAELAMA